MTIHMNETSHEAINGLLEVRHPTCSSRTVLTRPKTTEQAAPNTPGYIPTPPTTPRANRSTRRTLNRPQKRSAGPTTHANRGQALAPQPEAGPSSGGGPIRTSDESHGRPHPYRSESEQDMRNRRLFLKEKFGISIPMPDRCKEPAPQRRRRRPRHATARPATIPLPEPEPEAKAKAKPPPQDFIEEKPECFTCKHTEWQWGEHQEAEPDHERATSYFYYDMDECPQCEHIIYTGPFVSAHVCPDDSFRANNS
ncbi:hypothetical protein PENSPDRAFT_651073 [Peniophora sp. CONT]|nr:hypothetical protein PENSPDRAFT_651073 [Peniophora sp. CONT]